MAEHNHEKQLLDNALDGAAEGRAGIVLVEGAAGSGKTTALEHLLVTAHARKSVVLLARCGRDELGTDLSTVQQLFEAMGEPLDAVCAAPRTELFLSLYRMVQSVADGADGNGLVVAVDDAHLADPVSLEWLGYLARRVDRLPILLVLTAEPHQSGSVQGVLSEISSHPAFRRLSPAPLTAAELHGLVGRSTGGPVEPAFVRLCLGLTRGNRQLAHELLRELSVRKVPSRGEEASAVEAAFSAVLPAVMSRRLHRQSEHVRAVAEALAVLGDRPNPDPVTEITGLPLFEVNRSIEELRRLNILDPSDERVAFSHPAVRSTVLAGLPLHERATAHLKAARTLYNRGASSRDVALHLEHTSPVGERWATDALRHAAGELTAVGDSPTAARLLRRALEEPLERKQRIDVHVDLAVAQLAAGQGRAVRHLDEALQLAREPMERASVISRLSYAFHVPDGPCKVVRVIERVIGELGDLPGGAEEDMRRRLQAQLIFHAHTCSSAAAASIRITAGQTVDLTTPGGQQLAGATVIFRASTLEVSAAETAAQVRRLTAAGLQPDRDGAMFFLLAIGALTMAGEFEEALRLLEWPTVASAGMDGGLLEGLMHHVEAGAERLRGRLPAAITAAERATTVLRSCDWQELVLPSAVVLWAECLIDAGRPGQADEVLRSLDTGPSRTRSWSWAPILAARGRLKLLRGDAVGADADLSACAGHAAAWPFDNPALLAWRSVAAAAKERNGDREAAEALLQEELQLVRRWGAPYRVAATLRAAAALAEDEAGIELLGQALALVQNSSAALEEAQVRVELGAAVHRSGRREAAREHLLLGLDLAESCGAAPLAERAYLELVATGARPRRLRTTGPAALTPTERQVATLAARGASNRDIAAGLFVTQRAVEKSLTAVYRKLDIAGRLQLAAHLGDFAVDQGLP